MRTANLNQLTNRKGQQQLPTNSRWELCGELLLPCPRVQGRHLGTGAAPDVPLSPARLDSLRALHAMLPSLPGGFPSILACKANVTCLKQFAPWFSVAPVQAEPVSSVFRDSFDRPRHTPHPDKAADTSCDEVGESGMSVLCLTHRHWPQPHYEPSQ